MDYTTLIGSIQAWAENYDTTFVSQLPELVKQVENRIATAVRLPSFSAIASITAVHGQPTSQTPADFLSVDSINLAGLPPLLKKDSSFLDQAYQNVVGRPRFYATQDATTILWGPTPDLDYSGTIRYFSKPPSLVTQTDGTYISNNFPAALLSGCLWQAALFMKDWTGAQIFQGHFLQALGQSAAFSKGPWNKPNFEKNSSAIDGTSQLGGSDG